MTAELVPLLVAFLLGALVGAAITAPLTARRVSQRRVRDAERVSAAEAVARRERDHRTEVESERDEAQETIRKLDRELAVARERVERTTELVAEQKDFMERARQQLADSFHAIAGEALKGNTEQFLALAGQKLDAERTQAQAQLDERKQAIEALLAPFKESLDQLSTRTGEIEQARVAAYSRIDEQVRLLAQAAAALEEKTTSLTTALSSSQVRGRWGEMALRNVAELAGMSEHCDFEEQATLTDGGRPDMTVHLPGGRRIAVDAKAPLSAYLEATDATSEEAKQEALGRHVRDLRGHIRQLASREYASALEGDVDLVVMFLPGDPFLGAAFSKDPELQVEALRSKVLIATPTTLVALLRTVAIYWQQQALAENAESIASSARELYERAAKFGDELSAVGKGLKAALEAYNRAVGSFDRRLLPMGRKLEEMKISEQSRRRLEPPEEVAEAPRSVKTP